MKKLLFLISIILLSFQLAEAKTYTVLQGLVTKQTNGSYIWRAPDFEYEWMKSPFDMVTHFSANFTSPRSSALSINHHSIDLEQEFGFTNGPWFGTVSVGGRYIFAGNSDGIPEGPEFINSVRVGAFLEGR